MRRYSFSQPSSSDGYDVDMVLEQLEAEVAGYREEVESRHHIVEAVQPLPQPECDDRIPLICYCGCEPVVETAYTSKDIGRRYFTCQNADDGGCHIWKWYDVTITEELCDYQRQLREVKQQATDSDEKLVMVKKTVGELAKKKSWIANGYPLVVSGLLIVLVIICMVVMMKWVEEKDNVLTESLKDLQRIQN